MKETFDTGRESLRSLVSELFLHDTKLVVYHIFCIYLLHCFLGLPLHEQLNIEFIA